MSVDDPLDSTQDRTRWTKVMAEATVCARLFRSKDEDYAGRGVYSSAEPYCL